MSESGKPSDAVRVSDAKDGAWRLTLGDSALQDFRQLSFQPFRPAPTAFHFHHSQKVASR
jgi:hypothetical protein